MHDASFLNFAFMQKMVCFLCVDQEMIFRGADTVAILMGGSCRGCMVLHPDIQAKAQSELDAVVATRNVTDADVANLPYVQSVVKETLRMHPPGPAAVVGAPGHPRRARRRPPWSPPAPRPW